ncbi:MAG: DUF362 domain-containing protein [Nitrospinales bacterium]
MKLNDNSVAINFIDEKKYLSEPPFDPPEDYPEYRGKGLNPKNKIYAGIRQTLYQLGLDAENFNTPEWNPFKDIIKPGMTVFLKPNTVRHFHVDGGDVLSVIVHASIVRPILDYVCIALKEQGKIIIGDSQVIFGKFDEAYDAAQISDLLDWYRNQTSIPIECFDLRIVRGTRTWLWGKWGRKKVEQDPLGYTFVDLGDLSCFKDIDPKRLRIAIASHKNMYKHHSNGKHEYLIPNSFLQSDVVINIPKFKTHRRTAITLALKSYMGIPALKDSLPHFITGSVEEGGDQYINPSLRKKIVTTLHDNIQSNPFTAIKFVLAVIKKILWNTHWIVPFKDDVYEAMWYGNDTLWRTLVDLNRIVFYADKEGKIRDTTQRDHFFLIDGIIGGEKNGPVSPDPVPLGLLMAGFNSPAMDAVGATLMGFDIEKIPLIKKALETNNQASPLFSGNPADIKVLDNGKEYTISELGRHRNLNFEPHPGWKGHVEIE